MNFEEYKIMYEAEDRHWWYRGLRGVMFTLLGLERMKRRSPLILDAGCGTGGNIKALLDAGQKRVEGFDFSDDALYFCRKRGLQSVRHGSIADIPFEKERFDVIISCDVLNDAGLDDDRLGIRELYRVLKPGGRLFLNLPAYRFLRGEHDQATSVARRYTARQIRLELQRGGFAVPRVTYWNMFLFPVVVAVRMLRPSREEGETTRSDIQVPHPLINGLLVAILKVEAWLIRRISLPFGSSVAVLAVKPRH